MCTSATFNGNKVLVCQVGGLVPGQQYRTPDGKTMLVIDHPAEYNEFTMVVDMESGRTFSVNSSVNLGRDRAGRLYASRSLNEIKSKTTDVAGQIMTWMARPSSNDPPKSDDMPF